jgi:hypothetical protein
MGLFDKDPKYQKLKHIREVEGYKGWLDKDLNKVSDAEMKKWTKEQAKKHGKQ